MARVYESDRRRASHRQVAGEPLDCRKAAGDRRRRSDHREAPMDVTALVEPDRVHKTVYTDQQIFDREMERIWERIWVYCGHESQVPMPGDYYAVTIGRQPMLMISQPDRSVQVLYNRCPHRGVQVVGNLKGNTGSAFVCSYHAWSFHLDGSVRAIPLAKGYEGTRMTRDNPDCEMKRAARVDSYRGFVFASLAADGPTLLEFLGQAKVAFDDMCDRSPVGEVEVVPICHRVMQHSNWKFFMENQLDALHPSVTHQSTGISAGRVEKRLKAEKGAAPLYYHYLSTFASSFEQWDSVQTINFPHGHGILKAYMGLRPRDPDTLEYEALLKKAYGEAKTEEYLSRSIHHVLVYPYLSVQSPLQQLRCLRPVGPDKTISEIWHFRLKGAPEAIYRRSLWYYNLVNSPATMINADDLENWTKGQWGLQSNGGDWVSLPLLRRRPRGERRHLLEPRHLGGGDAQPVQGVVGLHARRLTEKAMAKAKDSGATRAIPTAGPDFEHLLAQEVVIEAGDAAPTGAQRVAPDHSPRAKTGTVDSAADALPKPGAVVAGDVQREVEQFLYRQAELLDGKHWQAFMDLFDEHGVYWRPVTPQQTEWQASPS